LDKTVDFIFVKSISNNLKSKLIHAKNQQLSVVDTKKGIPAGFSCKVCERFMYQQRLLKFFMFYYFFPKMNRSRPTICEVRNKMKSKNRKKITG